MMKAVAKALQKNKSSGQGNRKTSEVSAKPPISELTADASTSLADPLLRPFALRAMFMRPVYLEKSAWLEHIPFAFWLVAAHQPKVLVELGTHYGSSYFAFCQAVERLGQDARCFAVDTWKGDEHAGFYGEEVFEKVRAHNDGHYSDFSRLIRSTFDEAVAHFSDGMVDLLHIDGLHTLEAVRHDFERWRPKLSNRAIVLFHDCNVRERQFGVFKLIEELREKHPCFEFAHGHGLAVLSVGADQNDLVRRLLEADKDEFERRAVHEVFGRLGRACSDAYAARAEQHRARDLETAIVKHKGDFENVRTALERTKAELAIRAKEVSDLKVTLKGEAEQRAVERGQLGERASMFQSLRDELKDDIARLNARIDGAAADLKERTDAAFGLQNALRDAERQLYDMRRQADLEKTALQAAYDEVGKIRKTLEAVRAELEVERLAKADLNTRLRTAAAARTAAENGLNEAKKAESFVFDQHRQAVEKLQGEIAATQARAQAATADLDGEREAVAAAQNQLRLESVARAAVEKTAEERLIESEKLSKQLHDIAAERDKLKTEIAALEGQLSAAAADLDGEREAVAAAQNQLRLESAARAAVEKTAEKTLMESEKLSKQLHDIAAERDKLKTEIAALEGQLSAAAVELVAEQKIRAGAEKAADALRAEAKKQAALLSDAGATCEKLKNEIQALYSKLKDRFDETAKLTELYLSEKLQNQNLTQLIANMERSFDQRSAEFATLLERRRLAFDSQAGRARANAVKLFGSVIGGVIGYTKEKRLSRRGLQALARKLEAIGLFDAKWYLERYGDVAQAGVDPAIHYVEWGIFEGREPRDIAAYLEIEFTDAN